ncbi:CDP-alcohol phosphatidyltransferase family protein [Nesterenkonia sp. Act20]|uniref:CDP-alcohol phosphatidyltransferase family protein n=1 Tax=Nesterenkonia sp. Act20 TaxID=1483432 RepID=UPI001C43B47F|nr:CDP-alcohol phosphatidyltransferase family protein [Nesterenkonia sp. Act20]
MHESARRPAASTGQVWRDVVVLLLIPGVIALVLAVTAAPNALVAVVVIAAAMLAPTVAGVSLLRRRPLRVTTADRVTLFRVALTGVLAATAVLIHAGALDPRSWILAVVIGLALVLDAVDGAVARYTRSSSTAGARLDMEADAAALLIVSVIAAATVGWWAAGIGLMRYLFVAAGWVRPALRGEMNYSFFRRSVAATQAVALFLALLPVVPAMISAVILAIALILLIASFGRDALTLERMES